MSDEAESWLESLLEVSVSILSSGSIDRSESGNFRFGLLDLESVLFMCKVASGISVSAWPPARIEVLGLFVLSILSIVIKTSSSAKFSISFETSANLI